MTFRVAFFVVLSICFFFFQAEDGIRDWSVTGVQTCALPISYTLALATKMLEVFESESLDLLHVHYAIPHSVSAMLARSMAAPRRLPFVTTLHGTDITLVGSNRSYLPITRFSIEQSDGVTAISRYLLNQT